MSVSTVLAPQHSQSRLKRWYPLFICVITSLLYLPTLRFEFVYDDSSQIAHNPLITSWKNLPLLFRTDVWRFQNPLVTGNFWRPMFMAWLLINHLLFGLNTVWWHATTILMHVLCTYLLYRLAIRLGGDVQIAAVAALVFAIHPSHLETVAWISGVTDSLLSVLILSSLLCFIRALDLQGAPRLIWFAISLVLYALALLTKETAIVDLVFIVAYLLLFRRSEWKFSRACTLLSTFLAATAAYLIARHSVLGGFSHTYVRMTIWQELITVPSMLWFYLRHLCWPVGLSVMYDVSPITQLAWSTFWLPLGIVTLSAVGLWMYVLRSRDRLAAFAGVVLIFPLLPVLYVPVLEPGNFLHDRYLYLPSAGFAILISIAVGKLRAGSEALFGFTKLQTVVLCIVIAGSSLATARQQIFWANDVLLFRRATAKAPGSAAAFNNLGTALAARGHLREAMFSFQQVIRRDPNSWRGQYNVGLGYFVDGNYPEAELYLQKAIELNPVEGDPAAVLAEARIRQRKYAEAEPAILHAIAVKPYQPGYRRVLALSLEGQGKLTEAMQAAEAELTQHPQDIETKELLNRLRKEQESDRILPTE